MPLISSSSECICATYSFCDSSCNTYILYLDFLSFDCVWSICKEWWRWKLKKKEMEHQENNVQQNTYIWIESATKASSYKEVITLGRRNWKQSNLPLLLLLIYFSPLTLSSTSFGRFVMSFFCSLNINPLYHPRFKEPDNDPHPLHPPTTLRSINMKLVV